VKELLHISRTSTYPYNKILLFQRPVALVCKKQLKDNTDPKHAALIFAIIALNSINKATV